MPRAVGSLGHRLGVATLVAAVASGACEGAAVAVDLVAPEVVAASLTKPRTIEVGTGSSFWVLFSEPLDRASVHAGTVALVPWETVGDCSRSPVCEQGSCERGRCQEDPLRRSDGQALGRGQFAKGVAVALELSRHGEVDDALLTIRPKRALDERWRYSLVIGKGVRDRAGAPLSEAPEANAELQIPFRRDFVTAEAGSFGPEPRLLRPMPEARAVPTNLKSLEVWFRRPVREAPGDALSLVSEGVRSVALVDPVPCAGAVPGYCLQFALAAELGPRRRYALGPGRLRDRFGHALVLPPFVEGFETGDGFDRVAPDAAQAVVQVDASGCVVASYPADEIVTLTLQVEGHVDRLEGEGLLAAALPVGAPDRGFGTRKVDAVVEVEDLAGNRASQIFSVEVPVAGDGPCLLVTEVLANPKGAESKQEFVEFAVGPCARAARFSEGAVWIADLDPSQLARALAEGTQPGDPLPAFEAVPGRPIVVVPASYDLAATADPTPASGATVLRLDSTLGDGGLKNEGEPITLYDPVTGQVFASYGNHLATDASAHNGVSVVRVPGSTCDVARAFSSEPRRTSTPGRIP